MLVKLWAWARNLLTHPTVEVAFVQSVLAYAISQGLFSLSVEQTGVVMAVVSAATGLVAAALTQEALLVWLISLGQAVAALVIAFDLAARFGWNTQTVASWIALAGFLFGLVQHSKATPKYGPLAESRRTADGAHVVTSKTDQASSILQQSHASGLGAVASEAALQAANTASGGVTIHYSQDAHGEPISVPADTDTPVAHCPPVKRSHAKKTAAAKPKI